MHKNRIVHKSVFLGSALFIALGITRPAEASGSFDGNWTFRYSCDGATGTFAEQCLRGEGDSFLLVNLTQIGGRICGYHIATGDGRNRIDEGDLDGKGPSIYGTVAGNVATVQFRSAWTGTVGVATITLLKDSIAWHVVRPIEQLNWFPDDAVLTHDTSRLRYRPIPCDAAAVSPNRSR
jgi:hypothetical protein